MACAKIKIITLLYPGVEPGFDFVGWGQWGQWGPGD